jgi:hypothetical protein
MPDVFPWIVFIDANIFIEANLNFRNPIFSEFSNLAKDGFIRPLLTDITLEEIKKHQVEKIFKAFKSLENMRKDTHILSYSENPVYELARIKERVDQRSDREAVVIEFQTQLETYLQKSNFTIVPLDGTATSTIFNRYFRHLPPFGKTENKKNEFPDAFALASIESWLLARSSVAFVIGRDKLVKEYCAEKSNLTQIDSLQDFLEKVVQFKAQQGELETLRFTAFRNWIRSNPNELIAEFEKQFLDIDFYLDGVDGEVEIVDIVMFLVTESSVLRMDSTNGTATFSANVHFVADATFIDESRSYFDKEEGRYLFVESETQRLVRDADVDFEVQVLLADNFNDASDVVTEIQNVVLTSSKSGTFFLQFAPEETR